MRKVLYVLVFTVIAFSAFAQKDKVYLKNGGLIRGAVQDVEVADTVVIKIGVNKIFLPISVIEEIKFKKRQEGRPDRYKNLTYQRGFYKSIKAGLIVGSHSYNNPPKASFMLEGGYEYHYHPLLNGGIGAGVNFYENYTVIPTYLQYQALFGRKQKSLFAYGQFGYGFVHVRNVNEEIQDVKGGRMFGLGLGIQKRIGNSFIKYKIGYQSQRIVEKAKPSDWIWGWTVPTDHFVTRNRKMNRLVLSVAYSF